MNILPDCIVVGERIARVWESLCYKLNRDPNTMCGVPIYYVASLSPSEIYGFGKGAKVVGSLPSQEELDRKGKSK